MTALDLAWRPGANVAASLLRAPEADPALLSHTERERMATFGHPDRQHQARLLNELPMQREQLLGSLAVCVCVCVCV